MARVTCMKEMRYRGVTRGSVEAHEAKGVVVARDVLGLRSGGDLLDVTFMYPCIRR